MQQSQDHMVYLSNADELSLSGFGSEDEVLPLAGVKRKRSSASQRYQLTEKISFLNSAKSIIRKLNKTDRRNLFVELCYIFESADEEGIDSDESVLRAESSQPKKTKNRKKLVEKYKKITEEMKKGNAEHIETAQALRARLWPSKKRVSWSQDETNALFEGYEKYQGERNIWSLIKKDDKLKDILFLRTNVDLKDKWRNLNK
eukprot:snap_masked-scaffold_13-processed-gene-4.44-mRNA-1 protein AED:1.00 eAED:1.00 QI:0/-1/0/0/-1/1/1/0/201